MSRNKYSLNQTMVARIATQLTRKEVDGLGLPISLLWEHAIKAMKDEGVYNSENKLYELISMLHTGGFEFLAMRLGCSCAMALTRSRRAMVSFVDAIDGMREEIKPSPSVWGKSAEEADRSAAAEDFFGKEVES